MWLLAPQDRPPKGRESLEGRWVWEPFPEGAGQPQGSPVLALHLKPKLSMGELQKE